jgi:hypothetical protein
MYFSNMRWPLIVLTMYGVMEQYEYRYGYVDNYKAINQYIVRGGVLAERFVVGLGAVCFYVGGVLQHSGVGCSGSRRLKKVGRGVFTVLAEYFEVGFAELEFMGILLGLFYRDGGIAAQGIIISSFSQQAAGEKCKQYDCKQCYFLHDDQKLNQVVEVYTGIGGFCLRLLLTVFQGLIKCCGPLIAAGG